MKKVLSVFLAVVMILSICTVGVSASDYVWIYTSRQGAQIDNYLYFPVYYDNGGYYACYGDEDAKVKITIPFFYDPEVLKPVEVTPSELLYGMNFESEISRIDVYKETNKSGYEVTYPYFYADITFDGDTKIDQGEVLFNVKMEIIGDLDANNGIDLFDHYYIVEDLEQEKLTCCKWEVFDGDGNVVYDISSKIWQNVPMDGIMDEGYILEGYEPFIPPVEKGKLTADTKFESGETYYIDNYEDLKTLSYLINEKGESTQGVTFVQTKDIVANSGTFSLDENNAPLYNGSSSLPEAFESIKNFSGIFDGQNYTISGLYLNAGLFENCEGAEIKNIYIENSLVLNEDEASSGLGTVSSVFANSTLTGCSVDAIVIGEGNDVGGVVGKVTGSTVKYCRNLGNVFGGTNVGGMAGSFETACKVSACYNAGNICGESYVGGFAGKIAACDLISYSYNIGDVEAIATSGYAGGFAGYFAPKEHVNHATVSRLYTVGEVKGSRTGEFCGRFFGMFFEMFDMERLFYVGSSLREFDSEAWVSYLWDMYEENGNSIMYPPGSYYPAVQYFHDINPSTDAEIKDMHVIDSEFVTDAAGENGGYPMIKYFHKEHTFSDYMLNEDGSAFVAKCNSTNCSEINSRSHTHLWGEYTNDANGNPVAECLDEKCTFSNVKEKTLSSATIDPIAFASDEGKIYNFILKTDGDYRINVSALEKASLAVTIYLNGEKVEQKTIIKWSDDFPSAEYVSASMQNPTVEIELEGLVAGDSIVVILSDNTTANIKSTETTNLAWYLKHYSQYFTPSSVTITVENTTPVEEEPLFEFGVTAQHIRNKFDMLYYPVSFGFSMYDDADIRYSDICADVADLAFGCDTEVVMKYIYDATTLDFVYVYDDSWNGSVKVLEHGSTGMTGDEGQEYNYIILKAKFSAVGYADGKAPFFLKFAVVEDNFINSDGTVRKVIDNVPYSEDQLCVWNAWDHEGDSFDFSNRIEFKSSDYETSGQTYDDLLLEDDIIATDVDMPTVTFTPEHARKDDLAYYPCMYDSNVDYDDWVRSATGFKDSTTKIQIKVDYDSSTLELLDALPSKELYDLGGTVTIIETGDLYPDNPDYGHMKYAVVQLDFDALDFTDGCLFSLKFRVLQENFLDEKGRPIDLVNSFVADWVVTSNDGKSHDLRYYVSSSYLGLATFGSYEELILADYEPFDPILLTDVTEVTYVQQEDTHKTFTVTANGRKQMIQFIEPDGGTRTYDRYNKNVKITSYNADGEVVSSMARDLAYEVWEIYSNMSVGVEIQVRGKENYKWDEFRYSFTIEPYNPIISMELSATSGKKGAVPATVVADEKTEKVMFKMPNNTSVTVSTFTTDENGNRVFKGKAWMNEDGLNEIEVKIYRKNVWKSVGTLEYTVE